MNTGIKILKTKTGKAVSVKFWDITESLDRVFGTTFFKFNPTIAPFKDSTFFCAFNTFSQENNEENVYNTRDQNHPWDIGWGINTMINKSIKFAFITLLDEGSCMAQPTEFDISFGVDGRLLEIYSDSNVKNYFLSYNANILEKEKFSSIGKHRQGSSQTYLKEEVAAPLLIAGRSIWLTLYENGSLGGNMCPSTFICPELSSWPLEKNWSIWKKGDDDLQVSYAISQPYSGSSVKMHETFTIKPDKKFSKNDCRSFKCIDYTLSHDDNYFLLSLKEAFGLKTLFFSCTTPSIKYNNDNYLAVGHIKWDPKETYSNPESHSLKKFQEWADKMGYKNSHGQPKNYLNFFYEFNSNNNRIVRMSPFIYWVTDTPSAQSPEGGQNIEEEMIYIEGFSFYPWRKTNFNHTKSIVQFPCGLCRSETGDFIVSYGDADTYSCIIEFKSDDVEDMLLNVPFISESEYRSSFEGRGTSYELNESNKLKFETIANHSVTTPIIPVPLEYSR